MDSSKDPDHAWTMQTRRRTQRRDAATRSRVLWGVGALLAALLLLASFYQVLDQAMQRAGQHWAPSDPGAVRAGPCAAGSGLQPGQVCGQGERAH